MTTISSSTTTSTTSTTRSATTAGAERHLRLVLRANGASSLAFGLAGAIGASYWSDVLGFDHTGLTVAVSIALAVFGADVLWLATRSAATLRRGALAVSALDLGWVAATAAVVAAGALTTAGAVLAVVIGLAVADFAALQLWFRRRIS